MWHQDFSYSVYSMSQKNVTIKLVFCALSPETTSLFKAKVKSPDLSDSPLSWPFFELARGDTVSNNKSLGKMKFYFPIDFSG